MFHNNCPCFVNNTFYTFFRIGGKTSKVKRSKSKISKRWNVEKQKIEEKMSKTKHRKNKTSKVKTSKNKRSKVQNIENFLICIEKKKKVHTHDWFILLRHCCEIPLLVDIYFFLSFFTASTTVYLLASRIFSRIIRPHKSVTNDISILNHSSCLHKVFTLFIFSCQQVYLSSQVTRENLFWCMMDTCIRWINQLWK